MPLLPALMRDRPLRLALAGAQDKLPVRYAAGALALPAGGAASTHVIKVGDAEFPGLVENEYFCLKLADAVGLPAPPADIAPTATPMLIVERYDRVRHGDIGGGDSILRRHQEDFCQALDCSPETKYESEGGPGLAALFACLARCSVAPLPDRRQLLRWVVFNALIGNEDAHAKNVSLLYGTAPQESGPVLAPFYDLVCTTVYDELRRKLAMGIGGQNRLDRLEKRHWERFAAAIDVKPRYLLSLIAELAEQVDRVALEVAEQVANRFPRGPVTKRVVESVQRNVERLTRMI
jgi:serine/threonine-protein kinase HipA